MCTRLGRGCRAGGLSDGRLTLGVGLGSDRFAGEPVRHRGEYYTVDDIAFLPRPVQRPGVPVWAAGFPGNVKPIRRAARLDGFFPANLEHPDQLAEVVSTLTELRHREMASYDIAVSLPPGADPEPYAKAGATWWLPEFEPGVRLDTVRGVLRDGPAT
ncbi:LLM class flavin-dependent oxidoreductase [Streptomyces sp. NBC_01314]|uniref:LLM class flavin-dependent oxidoreductase n=1 Tax=Streptomyces sp. NBC_01314 TaxID=2903821 RepID=UPI0030910884|nr:LLM class flavin-dependent oxidoreductase [Streptomyces sp. NBC_01314]